MPETLLCIASNASLLYLLFLVISSIPQVLRIAILGDIGYPSSGIQASQGNGTRRQFIVVDIGPVCFANRDSVDPIAPALGKRMSETITDSPALLKTPPPRLSAWPWMTWRDGCTELAVHDMGPFLAALKTKKLFLKTRSVLQSITM